MDSEFHLMLGVEKPRNRLSIVSLQSLLGARELQSPRAKFTERIARSPFEIAAECAIAIIIHVINVETEVSLELVLAAH